MTILEAKEQAVLPPLAILCDLSLADGSMLRWGSITCSFDGHAYLARITDEKRFKWRLTDEITNEGNNNCVLRFGDADGQVVALMSSGAFRGAYARIFVGACVSGVVSDRSAFFAGVLDSFSEVDSTSVSVSITNRLNASRAHFPPMRIQKRCSWSFPRTAEERIAARGTGEDGRYSSLFRCGYSPDVSGGAGNLDNGQPFKECDYSREACEARGMFASDSLGQVTRRFSGIEFIPASVLVRGHGESVGRLSNIVSLDARFNDVVPAVYGTGWLQAPLVFSRNDGNLTRGEVLLGLGEIERVIKVLVNGFEIPLAVDGRNMTGTGWYRVVSKGNRAGVFNGEFIESNGTFLGDPYGSLAFLSIAVPNRVSDGKSSMKIEVLMDGMKLPILDNAGALDNYVHSRNPAWIMCDVLRRSGWKTAELDLASFRMTAEYCDELISVKDANGTSLNVARFETNLILKRRYSVGELLRGIRLAAQIQIVLNRDGRIGVRPEVGLSIQQPMKPNGSNTLNPLNNGWTAYDFGDGSNNSGGILLNERNEPQFLLSSKAGVDSANRVGFEIQDALNEFRQDSISVVDTEDAQLRRTEVTQSLPVLGVPNFPQALRICQTWLNRAISGNVFVELQTTVRGIHLRPGDLISISYVRYGLDRTLFRIREVQISSDLQRVHVSCQLHQDDWYSDNPTIRYGAARKYSWGHKSVRAVCGTVVTGRVISFTVQESLSRDPDGLERAELTIPFIRPRQGGSSGLNAPLVSFDYDVSPVNGSLIRDTYFYAVTSVDASGNESFVSSLIQVSVNGAGDDNRVILHGISSPQLAAGMNLYRGTSPHALVRVASGLSLSTDIIDSGLSVEPIPAPDEKYLYVQAYWRKELLAATPSTIYSQNTVGNATLALNSGEWVNRKVFLLSGKGRGQERLILSNSETTLVVERPWDVTPDFSTEFCIVESSWRRGESAESNEIKVFLPPWSGDSYQINLRSVGSDQVELDSIESPIVRWRLGVGGTGTAENGPPPAPSFGLSLLEGGTLLLSDIGFEQPRNLDSVFAALLNLWFWDELKSPTPVSVAAPLGVNESVVTFASLPDLLPSGSRVQIGSEILEITDSGSTFPEHSIIRGLYGTSAAAHSIGTPVFELSRHSSVISFLPGFLNSTAGASFTYPLRLPNIRLACASLTLCNRFGKSPAFEANLMVLLDNGLRTLSGGQVILNAQGYLSIEASAGNTIVLERLIAVRDVFAVVEEAPQGGDIQLEVRVDGTSYAGLTIPAGQLSSVAVNRFNFAPLASGSKLSFDILGTPSSSSGSPGRDLTVFLRT